MGHEDDFRHSLRERGYRITPQRELILAAVRAGDGHCTADEVFHRVAAQAPGLSRATVYRTLEFLVREHLVTSADLGEGRRVYESVESESHHHLVCTRCRAVQQIDHDEVAVLYVTLQHKYGFRASADHLAFFGLCRHCLAEVT
jgi:Fur family ferric uptake transcriptional regulator